MPSVVVFKIGGHIAVGHLDALARAARAAESAGKQVVVVHGGGPSITRALTLHGLEMPFVNGIRVTSNEAMEVVADVLRGEVNPGVVSGLRRAGVAAIGVTDERAVIQATVLEGFERTGQVTRVNTTPLLAAMDRGQVPVLSPVGVDPDGKDCNVNADLAAAAVAGALRADRLVFLTDVHGIYETVDKEKLVRRASTNMLASMRDRGCFRDGMLPKVEAILSTLAMGTKHVFVVHGEDQRALDWSVRCDPHRLNVDWTIRGTCITTVNEGAMTCGPD